MTDYTWNGGASGVWNSAANWLPNTGFPSTNGDTATIGGSSVVSYPSTLNYTLKAVTLTGTATLNIAGYLGSNGGNGLNALTVGAGATVDVQTHGTFYSGGDNIINGNLDVEGTFHTYSEIGGTGTVTFDGGTNTGNGFTVDANSSLSFVISNGSTVNFTQAPSSPNSIMFGAPNGGTNTLNLANYTTTITAPITGFGPGDDIKISGDANQINYITYTHISGNTYSIAFGHEYSPTNIQTLTTISSITFNGNYNTVSGPYTLTGGDLYTFSDVCFLEGTAIATPSGEVAVETLQIGDLVTTIVAGEAVAKPVKWLGYRSVKPGDLTSEDAHPIRIKAGAFAENMPHRDLLVTPEHCILVDGGLTPARLLVNGRSIIVDTGISSFTYYHVELEEHGILLAEGLATESYLDTGNRGRFANSKVTAFRFRLDNDVAHNAWEHAAAPLTVDPASVEPVWRTLNARAEKLGFAKVTADPALTTDPDLHIVTADGAVIRPMRQHADKFMFLVPAGTAGLTIASRTARPSETVGPFIDDRRELGVLVGEIALYEGRKKSVVNSHLAEAELAGWFGLESNAQRWTNGSAKLPVDLTKLRGQAAILEIQIVNAGPYPLAAEAVAAAQAA